MMTGVTRRRLRALTGAGLFSFAVTVLVTWPQAIHPTLVADHFDPYFSVWRLAHIAHALTRWPIDLFDANIFYPARNTLAFSDATLLQGVLAAPLFWARLSPTFIYNVMLLAGFVGSGVAMFVLARHLTGANGPSLVATAVFTALPYRIEHFMHLEMQWAMFIPLAFWAVHRTLESGRWQHGLLVGLFLWLQFLSCVYYGVFLCLALVVFTPLLLTFKGHVPFRRYAPPLAAGVAAAALLTLPYAWTYLQAAEEVGSRPLEEITRYSAQAASYIASPGSNRLWGWTADLYGAPELRLFPGLVAIVLALVALGHPRLRLVGLYAVTTVLVVQLSFGLNGTLYRALLGQVTALQGFRALARFGILSGCTIAVLAALGTQALLARVRFSKQWRRAFVPLVLVAMAVEYANRPLPLSYGLTAEPPDLYRALNHAEPGTIMEFPAPLASALPGADPEFQAWSIWHWRPLVNGYSGYYPPHYLNALAALRTFPDERSLALLRDRQVRYVIVHRARFDPRAYADLAIAIANTPALRLWGVFKDPVGIADIFELQP